MHYLIVYGIYKYHLFYILLGVMSNQSSKHDMHNYNFESKKKKYMQYILIKKYFEFIDA